MGTSREVKPCAIAILNWNGVQFLKEYLPTLIEYSPEHLAKIYVIDNQSTDDSFEFVTKNYPQIQWIQNQDNYGFAKGYNEGLKHIEEPIYCLLNSDIEVTEGWLEPILNYFDAHQNVAAIQPKILDLKNKSKFEYAGGSGGFYDRFGYAVCRGRYFDYIEEDNHQYDDIVDIFWGSGCCLFVRRAVYWEVGGMDDDYFAHQEEIDLCWRIANLNYKIVCYPQSTVYHYGGGSLPYGSSFKSYLNFRNSLFNLFKNLTRAQLFVILPTRLFLDGVAAVHSLIRTKSLTTAFSILRAHGSFYHSIPKLISKRRKIKNKGYPNTTVQKYILLDYYVYHCRKYSQLVDEKKA